MPTFQDFPLQAATRAVLAAMNITEPTPIQLEAIPALLAGRDLVGQSATGSGKTLAYSIPLIEQLSRKIRAVQALILVPTRELAIQVASVLDLFARSRRLTTALLVGGQGYGSQFAALRSGAQIVVGTPGRIKDHLERGSLTLTGLRICILDEADQMLDNDFAPAIEDILATTPETRQMALFSATIPAWVEKIQEKFLKDPLKVSIGSSQLSTIEQIVYQVPHARKIDALCTLLLSTRGESSLIFGKTRFGVEKLGMQLSKLGFAVATLHGDKSQRAREEVLTAFRRGHVQTLLATNVAARGLDIKGIHQVINYELPESSELFTHRIGRTGRMGHTGKAITLLSPADMPRWRRMSRGLGQPIAVQKLTIDSQALQTLAAQPEPVPVVIEPASIENEQPAASPRTSRKKRQAPRDQEPQAGEIRSARRKSVAQAPDRAYPATNLAKRAKQEQKSSIGRRSRQASEGALRDLPIWDTPEDASPRRSSRTASYGSHRPVSSKKVKTATPPRTPRHARRAADR
ncbi:MAG: DEAD/DEAH box helicase [Ktedonobacteraceae bacterium]|nr:DEAD/DEAH box helicase [Ktedonobacteraceae bacterium]